jgi:hypothetical protein
MKLLFASSDPALVERFKNKLTAVGISSEVRRLAPTSDSNLPCYPELWVANTGTHYETAVALFANFQSSRN